MKRVKTLALVLSLAASVTALGAPPAVSTPTAMRHVANIRRCQGSDIEFATKIVPVGGVLRERDYAFLGCIERPVQVIDITNPEQPVRVAEIPCSLNQNDIQVRGDVLVMAADGFGFCERPTGSEFVVTGFATADISDPRSPVVLGSAYIPEGAHNVTVHPVEPLVYVSSSVTVSRFVHSALPGVVHIWDISDPAEPVLVRRWEYTPLTPPHDITFNAGGTRAYAASHEHTDIFDTTDPRRPRLIVSFADPTINISHQADPTPDGRYLLVSDEMGGSTSPVCPGGGVHVFDLTNEAVPRKVGVFYADDVGPLFAGGFLAGNCTAHVFRINPDGRTMAIAWYQAGVMVFDISHLEALAIAGSGNTLGIGPRTIGVARMPYTRAWAAKMWPDRHPGYVFVNDIVRGFDVFHLDPA